MPNSRELAAKENPPNLPAILLGNATPATRARVAEFFSSVATIFESWVRRRQSPHTQRAYREDVMAFVKFMGLDLAGPGHGALARLRPGRAGLPRPGSTRRTPRRRP